MPDPAATQLTTTPVVAAPDHDPAILPDGTATIDITEPAFARRFANLLTDRRAAAKRSLGAMARRSDKHFSRRALRRYEAGEAPLDMVTVSALASLYEVDIDAIVPLRTEIDIDGGGVIAAGGVTARFAPGDPDSLLETYLRLVRRLRDQERAEEVSLRREDIDRLAAHLGTSGESVVERLGTLMGATKAQRRVMAGLFLTGAMVITVAVPSVAALSGGSGDPGAAVDDRPTGGATATLMTGVDPTGSDAGQTFTELTPPVEGAADSGIDVRRAPDGPDGSGNDVRSAPDGPGAISIDLLDAGPPAEPADPVPPDDLVPPPESTADDPVDSVTPADVDAPAEPVADPIPVADPPPAPQPPPPPEPAPAPTTPPEPDDVATGPPPVPEPPSVVVDPAPAPAPPPAPEPPPPAEDEAVAVGPPPVPAPSPPIVDPPTDD